MKVSMFCAYRYGRTLHLNVVLILNIFIPTIKCIDKKMFSGKYVGTQKKCVKDELPKMSPKNNIIIFNFTQYVYFIDNVNNIIIFRIC